MWRQLQQRDPAAFPHRADKGMTTLETLTKTFPLTDPKVTFLANVLLCQIAKVLFAV
jgi:hypothetical protein